MACPQRRGNAALYGLGIRLAIYHLWLLGTLLLAYLTPSSVPVFRLVLSFSTLAIFSALILHSSWGTISPLDGYISLLLVSGVFLTYLPLYLWDLVSMCNPFWDMTRWPRVPKTRLYKNGELVFMVGVMSYSIWFWGTGVIDLPNNTNNLNDTVGNNGGEGCQDGPGKGFFFTPVPLDAGLFRAVNIVFSVALMIGALIYLGVDLGWIYLPRWRRKQERRFEREMARFEMKGEEYVSFPPPQFLYSNP